MTIVVYKAHSTDRTVYLHVDGVAGEFYIEAQDNYTTDAMTEILDLVDRLGFEVVWDEEEAADLSDTTVRRNLRRAAAVAA